MIAVKRFFLLCVFLSACSGPRPTESMPTLVPVQVAYPPSMMGFVDAFSGCANQQQQIALYLERITSADVGTNAHVLLWWGEPPRDGSAYQLGEIVISPVVNSQRVDSVSSLEQFKKIYEGQTISWPDGRPVQVWTYPLDDPIRQTFEQAIGVKNLSPNAYLAPDPQIMLEAIAADADAVGYLPLDGVTKNQKVAPVDLNKGLAESIRQPLIVNMDHEPEGVLLTWLGCIQNSISSVP